METRYDGGFEERRGRHGGRARAGAQTASRPGPRTACAIISAIAFTHLPPGTRLGAYEIVGPIGAGGMGEVYRARDARLDRAVAIKILPPELVSDASRVSRFLQEARAASALNHPHVIAVYDIGESDSMHFIAMELVDGQTLRDLTSAGPLDRRKAVRIVLQVAEALTAAHAAGIIHRDLKPENVMVTAAGYAKVLDFGLAKLRIRDAGPNDKTETIVKETDPGTVMGTAGYMSPEQALGRFVDHRSDLFSLGCILYELVGGRRAFRGPSTVDTMHAIVHDEPQPLRELVPDAPPELVRIIRKALAKDPDERYQTARDLAIDLRDLLRELETNPSGATVPLAPARPTSRLPLWLAAVVAAGALVALAAVLLLRKDPAPEAPPAESFRIARLTATGKVIAAVVSGDGKFIAYVSSDQGLQSLWLRQIGSAQSLELVPPRRVGYWGLGFAPDGSIYYSVKGGEDRDGALYQISALGGNSRRILGGVDSGPTFSPDGKQVAFVRGRHPTDSQSALIMANSDGTGERTLAAVQSPEYFVPIFYTGPSWSPDGRQVAVSVIDRQKRAGRILGVDVKSGEVKTIAEGPWQMVANVVWTPHGDGLLAIAERGGDDGGAERTPRGVGGGMLRQVWFVPYPSGTPYQVTNDLFDYRLVSLSSDGKSLVTVASDVSSDLWLHATGAEPKRITAAKMDGGLGLAVMPDGRIVATSLESGKVDIWIMNSDGSGRTLLTRDPHDNRLPLVTPDGRSIVYLSIESDGPRVCRMNPDGSGRRVLARRNGPDSQMAISPDGRFVVYSTTSPDGKNHLVLARVPIDGGEPQYLTNEGTDLAAYSPDGTRIAAYSGSQLVILPADGGSPLQRLDSPTPFAFSHLLWTPDGKSLLVNTMPDDRANLWQLPLDGGPPRKLTDFDERMVMGFAPLPDGKGWVFARGDLSRDAVMITGWRRGTAKK